VLREVGVKLKDINGTVLRSGSVKDEELEIVVTGAKDRGYIHNDGNGNIDL
jgi:hypothetical protein